MIKSKSWVVLTLSLAVLLASSLQAQVLQQVPPDVLMVFKVNNLKAVSDKIGKMAQDLGLVAAQPALANPLAMFQGTTRMQQGMNVSGEMAVAFVDPAMVGGDDQKAILMFMPVSDYKAFLANDPNAKTEGEVSSVDFGEPMFATNWGQFAVISPSKELLSKKPSTGLTAPSVTSKELATKDAVFYANFSALRAKMLPTLQQGRVQAMNSMTQAIAGDAQTAKLTPILKAFVNQAFNAMEGFVNEAQGASFAMNFAPEGLNLTGISEFKPGGYAASNFASFKTTSGSLLGGLPQGKYLMYGGGATDPQKTVKIISDFVDPIMKEVMAAGPEMAPVQDYVSAIKAQAGALSGQTFGMLAPTGALGTESLLQVVSIQRGDAKAIIDSTAKMLDAEAKLMKSLNVQGGMGMTAPTRTANAATIDGVSFDTIVAPIDPNPQGAMAMQQAQAMAMMYGPKGMTLHVGQLASDKVLMVMGGDETVIKQAIASAKSGDAPIESSDAVKQVSAQLPKDRIGVAYVDVGQIATTGLTYMKMFGFAVPVQLPPNLPPIGAAISTEAGTAVRVDVHIPKTLVQSLIAAGMQAAMQMQGGPGGPGAGGPQGGGL